MPMVFPHKEQIREKILKRTIWRQLSTYMENNTNLMEDNSLIFKFEVKYKINVMKPRKAVGPDQIAEDLIKLSNDKNV